MPKSPILLKKAWPPARQERWRGVESMTLFAAAAMRFGELFDDRFQLRVSNERNRLLRVNPLNDPLSELWPGRALSSNQKWENLDLAVRVVAVWADTLFVSENPDRPRADLSPYAGFFEGFARSRFRGAEPFDRPALGHNPLMRLSRCDDENFKLRR